LIFTLPTPSQADDIRDLEIEGISIGDSLLDHLSKKEIITDIENNKPAYNYLTDEFGEVYLFGNFENYDILGFKVKPKDKNYTIYSIKASIMYDDKLDMCFAKQKEIEKEFSSTFKNINKKKKTFKFPFDPTGESVSHSITFVFDTGGQIQINCTKYKKSLKIENNWSDALQVMIQTKEIINWFNKPIN